MKKIILTFANVFFILVAAYTIRLFVQNKPSFDANQIINNSSLKTKTFQADIRELTLSDGIKVWFLEENSAPLVALDFCFQKSGYTFDQEGKQGVAMLASEMLGYGAGDFDYQTYQDLLEQNAISVDFDVSDDAFVVSMTTPTENMKLAFDILKAVLSAPHLKENHIQIVKNQQLTALKMQNENPEKVLANEIRKVFYGTHPLGHQALGLKQDVEKLSEKDLRTFYQKHFTKDNLLIALVGAISEDEAKTVLEDLFSSIQTTSEIEDLPPFEGNYVFAEQNVERDIPQVLAHFIAKGTTRLAKDFYPLYIANEVFGGSGLSSRLNLRAREKEGLTYGAYTYLTTKEETPSISGGFSTSKENYEKMRTILFEEWQKMGEFGITQTEFDTIKNNMLTSFNLRFTSLSDISSQLLYMQKEHLGMDFLQKRNEYVRQVTLDEVNQAAKKYFTDMPSVITLGNNTKNKGE